MIIHDFADAVWSTRWRCARLLNSVCK